MREIVGTAKIITYRATKTPAWFGDQIIRIALLINFTDETLFNKYIKHNDKIPHKIKKNPATNQVSYEVYFSLWPENEWELGSSRNSLRDQDFDHVQTPKYLEDEYSSGVNMLHPKNNYYIEELGNLIKKLQLTEAEISYLKTHNGTTLLPEITFKSAIRLNMSSLEDKYDRSVLQAALNYAQKYDNWLLIKKLTPEYESRDHTEELAKALQEMENSEIMLQKIMFPHEKLSLTEFRAKLQSFVLYNCPEIFEMIIPFVKASSTGSITTGLNLESTLKFIANVTTNPKDYPYSLFGKNPARIPLLALQSGLQIQAKPQAELTQRPTTAATSNVLRFTVDATDAHHANTRSIRMSWANSMVHKARNILGH